LGQSGSSYEVESGGVVCGVRGTVFEVSNNGGDVEATTHEGAVELKGTNGTQTVKAGETCHCHHGQSQWKKPYTSRVMNRYTAWKARKAACLAHRANPHSPRHPLSSRTHNAHR
jgi:ferric-dicitrate binding protein FerR (iron transport regulator)